MLKTTDILDESDKRLRTISKEVTFPLTKKDKETIELMLKYLHDSQNEEIAEKYDLRPGMGLAAIQVGVAKRYFVVTDDLGEGKFDDYILINPRIISNSVEKIYVEAGEGCLSVNRDVEGHIKRYARVTVEGFDEDGNKIKYRAREELSIAFQHEIDHLNGIIFYDRIDPNKQFYSEDEIRLI